MLQFTRALSTLGGRLPPSNVPLRYSRSGSLQSFFGTSSNRGWILDVTQKTETVDDFDGSMSVCYHYVTIRSNDTRKRILGRFNLGFFEDRAGVDKDAALLFLHGIFGDVKRWAGGRYWWSGQEKYKHLRSAFRRRLRGMGRQMPRMVSLSIPGLSDRAPWFLVERSDRPDSGLLGLYTDVIYPYLCEQLGAAARQLSLIGESMGGHSALRVMLNQPAETYRRVVLLCPALVARLSTRSSRTQLAKYSRQSGASPWVVWAATRIGRRTFSATQPQGGLCLMPHLEGRDLSCAPPVFISLHDRDIWGFQIGAKAVAEQLEACGADVQICEMGPHHGHIEPAPVADFLFSQPCSSLPESDMRNRSLHYEEINHEPDRDPVVLRMG
ncbi:MAG: alpha/beta fold hydrolase [Myxococcota bacterium]